MTPLDEHDQTLADQTVPVPPPALLPAAALLERLRACELLDATQWAETAGAPAATFPDARVLARDLIQRGWLTPFQINQLFQDRGSHLVLESYVLLERLGEGGMGQVFKARHRKLGHHVAIKIIRKDRLLNPDIVKRFRREIRTTSQLAHPHIVRAVDAGEGGGAYYFAMELIDGVDLAKLVRRGGMRPPREACEYIRQAALALQYAHEHGIVHRDVKPSNLLLRSNTPEPVVMILDLGLARRLDREGMDNSTTLTDEGAVMGTPDYIAPEQAEESHTVDGRADVYSLGCTLYYLLNAKPPFSGSSLAAKLRQHLFVEPTPVEQLRDDLPPGLAFVVRKMMAKRPEDRYQTAIEVAEALAAVFKDVPTAIPVVETPAAPLAIPLDPARTLPGDEKTQALPTTTVWRRKPWWTLLGLGGGGA
jgi:serine/threonine-protein kinase